MAKKAYVGVNGVARNVSKIYVGVNGVARKVVKGYVGVNGVAQQFWGEGSSGGTVHSSTGIEKLLWVKNYLTPVTWFELYKRANGLLYYFIAKASNDFNYMFTFTTNRDAMNLDMVYENGETYHIGLSNYIRVDDVIWFYDVRSFNQNVTMVYPNDFTPNCLLDNPAFAQMTDVQILTYVIENMI